ncbi:16S rRNA (cytidine(1402)-2'-O)-methyltransferase [candidate division Kazan bacterium]|uniref:Ribosomal RNA small subunit methyltransferase I n=1 Tax=candidate division Kazan bacterium TaxID=2202143 RepID=A0A420ZDH1_UNCK3|nr:MAG: 16S rRNA (cytidine(1402)-2'-O)-methyltransferase [candidate division Kazan bacterium]
MLFIVATPIGNLQDITLRALDTLKSVDIIAAEDTRQTQKLLAHFKIKKQLVSFHKFSRENKLNQIIGLLKSGKNIALVSDAGTPGISDPGQKLVAAARDNNIKIIPIPGPSAITTILSTAGINADSFLFVGFIPKKKGRKTFLKELSKISVPVVLFESPARVLKTLKDIREHLGERDVIVGRELTKIHEEILSLPVSQMINYFVDNQPKGEFVIVIT